MTPLSPSDLQATLHQMGEKARRAAHQLGLLATEDKNAILRAMAQSVRQRASEILAANQEDLAAGKQKGLTSALLDRLRLDEARLEGIASGIEKVADLSDPVGELLAEWEAPRGFFLKKVRVPIGVIGIIYESRPNVTSDAAVLCLKAGNATILRGGSEAFHSNTALAAALQEGGSAAGLPDGAIQLVPTTSRESVTLLAQMDQHLDLIIPRGGRGLIEAVVSSARMPVIKHYDGICHLYLDAEANPDLALSLVVDSKTQKPSVCNALETLLVQAKAAPTLLPPLAEALRAKGVELRGDPSALPYLGDEARPATPEDWESEYLDLILAVKLVEDLDEAIEHINAHGSHHTDGVITENAEVARRFQDGVDSACVFHNLSLRFADGEEFGFGAEIGISTDKLHARGPMGLAELTSYKYRAVGQGQTKAG